MKAGFFLTCGMLFPVLAHAQGVIIGAATTPNSTLQVAGSLSMPYTVTGTATSFTLTSAHQTIRRFSACQTITLPDAASCPRCLYTLINANGAGSGVALAVAGGSGIYDDVTSAAVATLSERTRISIQSDGSGWIVVGR